MNSYFQNKKLLKGKNVKITTNRNLDKKIKISIFLNGFLMKIKILLLQKRK